MKKTIFKINVLLILAFLGLRVIALAADDNSPCDNNNIPCWINKLQSKKWQERELAVSRLTNLPPHLQTEIVKDALIKLLEKESSKIMPDGGYQPEDPIQGEGGEFEYFLYLCKSVSTLADPKAIPIFLKIGFIQYLEPYGESVLDIIIERMTEPGGRNKLAAARVLNNFLKPKEKGYTAQGEARQKIRGALLKAAKDENEIVRGWVVSALSNFQDDEVMAAFEDIKKNDPDRFNREKAASALEKIKKAKGE